ncbi:phosphopantetheine-binding protein [Xenorhabdus sp. SF857]|uniref:phosphopantetheine-binding protein n=1 Tax=Xenorhabdus bakwenae TaxID=3026967 RepID=UPI0025580A4A|nr:phosphopantetheine-binding protein [Xenorhabdus sp. SF857]WFQ79986.1 phosphopantetheine-binding protein [Xenorhabdus sp. SF857]
MKNNEQKLNVLLHEIQIMLNESDVRKDDNFIELGGNSIMAMQIVQTLKIRDGILVNLAQLLGTSISQIELIRVDDGSKEGK